MSARDGRDGATRACHVGMPVNIIHLPLVSITALCYDNTLQSSRTI